MGLADDIIDRQQAKATLRAQWEPLYIAVAERMDPGSPFLGNKRGDMSKVYDSTPMRLLGRYASVVESLLCPRGQIWGETGFTGHDLDDVETRRFGDDWTDLLFKHRYAKGSSFAQSKRQCFRSLGGYGSEVMFVEEVTERDRQGRWLPPMRYRNIPMNQCFMSKNAAGEVDDLDRRYPKSARQLVETFGEGGVHPEVLRAYNSEDEKERQFDCIHAVFPPNGRHPWAYMSVYVDVENRHVMAQKGIEAHGYHEFPYIHSDFEPSGDGTPYSIAPAIIAIPDVKMMFAAKRTTATAMELSVAPPLATKKGLARLNLTALAVNPGYLDDKGNKFAEPIFTGADPRHGYEFMDRLEADLSGNFNMDLFQILVDKPQMTAHEAMIRAQEKGELIGPPFGAQEEALARMHRREAAILVRMGERGIIELPEVPADFQGEDFEMTMTSPLARMRKMGDVTSTLQTFEVATQMEALSPGVTRRTLNVEEALRIVGNTNGTPGKVMLSEEETEQIAQQEAEAAQQQQQQQAALLESEAARNYAPLVKAQSEANKV